METIHIERLGAQGDGVGDDGVLAAGALPGETVAGEIAEGRMTGLRVIEASGDRAPPPCGHFGVCGGCAVQHATDEFVAGWKREKVADALRARGLADVDIRPTATSPPQSRRRAVFTARRTKKSAIVGYHARRSAEIVGIDECPVLAPPLLAALPAIRDATRLGASRKGEVRATATLTEGGVDLCLDGGKELDASGLVQMTALAETHDLARLTWNGAPLATRAPPAIRFGVASVIPPPGGFLQATAHGEAALLGAVRDAIGDARRVLDLFAGCGTFTLPVAAAAEAHAVEGDAELTAALLKGARSAAGLRRITVETRDLFRRPLLGPELRGFDAAIIDPPRAGAAAQMEILAADGPPVIASISCDAGTFARDARTLIDGGYRLDWAMPVDQFRWSHHVEMAAKFSRR